MRIVARQTGKVRVAEFLDAFRVSQVTIGRNGEF